MILLRLTVALFVALLPIGAATAQALEPHTSTAPQSPDEALAEDGAEYAQAYGVGVDEAVARLRAQEGMTAATAELERRYAKRLAGIAVYHHPEYRIVMLLTGRKRVRLQQVQTGDLAVPVVFRTGARASRTRLLKALASRSDELRRAVRDARGIGYDARTGELVVMLNEGEAAKTDLGLLRARLGRIARVPVRVRVIERGDSNLAVEGGARVEGIDTVSGRRAYCTVGFVVTDGTRNGIVTAAHCPDLLTYVDPAGARVELPFIGQWGWSFQDVQLNSSDDAGRPVFFADSKKQVGRVVALARSRAATRAGDFVCHRGERTGYSCGEVELTDYAPPGALCGGPCAPTWVTVGGSCGGGDSGGPVFSGSTAYGIVKGGTYRSDGKCAFYYYMSVDYLPAGWSLLRADVPPPV